MTQLGAALTVSDTECPALLLSMKFKQHTYTYVQEVLTVLVQFRLNDIWDMYTCMVVPG